MSLVEQTAKDWLSAKVDEIYDAVEKLVKMKKLVYRYRYTSCAGIPIKNTGEMKVWRREMKSLLDRILRFEGIFEGDVLKVDFNENVVTLYDEGYRNLAEDIRGLLVHKKRWEESRFGKDAIS